MATFVDNLLSTGASPENATSILDDCEVYLKNHWKLHFGPEPREYMTCRGYHHNIVVDDRWPRKFTLKCLGHYGEIKSCFDHCRRAMWKSFFGNLNEGLARCSGKAKVRFLNSSIASIPGFRWSRWTYQPSYAASLDRTHRRMIAILLQIRPQPHENFEDYFRRCHTSTGGIASRSGRWSDLWARSVRNWNAHVSRNHDPATWSQPLLA